MQKIYKRLDAWIISHPVGQLFLKLGMTQPNLKLVNPLGPPQTFNHNSDQHARLRARISQFFFSLMAGLGEAFLAFMTHAVNTFT